MSQLQFQLKQFELLFIAKGIYEIQDNNLTFHVDMLAREKLPNPLQQNEIIAKFK